MIMTTTEIQRVLLGIEKLKIGNMPAQEAFKLSTIKRELNAQIDILVPIVDELKNTYLKKDKDGQFIIKEVEEGTIVEFIDEEKGKTFMEKMKELDELEVTVNITPISLSNINFVCTLETMELLMPVFTE